MPTLLPSTLVQVVKGGRKTQNEQLVHHHPFRNSSKKTDGHVSQHRDGPASDFSPGAERAWAWHQDEEAQVCGAVERLRITEHPVSTSGVL